MSTKSVNIIDLSVVVLLTLIVFLSINFYYNSKIANQPTYTIMVNDAYGLIIGSSVLFGGQEVGRVTGLKFSDNQVTVKFKLDDKNFPKIPNGSEITVKSTGLAGSKALEIYLPPNNKQEGIIIKDTIRQAEANNIQAKIAQYTTNSAHSISSAFSDTQLITIRDYVLNEKITANCTNVIETIILRLDEIQHKNKKLKDMNKKLEKHENANN